MNYCKKCGKVIKPKEETYRGLCFNCYQEYLFEKIEHIGDKQYQSKFYTENKFKKIIEFIKNFFTKKKK